uniref:SEA domain-containing protein n=1 Tax=Suricata suricatta TaxID=37032 RepID=A0A673VE34_SURSU
LKGGDLSEQVCICPTGSQGDQCEQEIVLCQNGGYWDGIKCVCTDLYQGPKCEDVVPSIEIAPPPETVSAQVEMTVTVTNMEFTKELEDRTSVAFQNFNDTFTKEMKTAYDGIPEYQGVNITRLSAGSVVVEHEVILKAKFTPEYMGALDKVTQQVTEIIKNVTKQHISTNNICTSTLCYNTTSTKVQNITITQYDPEKECQEKVGKEYAEYFFVEYKNQKPNCITRCMPGFNNSMNCHFGKCQLERSGPRCYCLTTDTEWYSGETCEFSTKKSLVFGLVGAAFAVVLIAIAVLVLFMFRSKKEVNKQKAKVTQLYKWHEEDGGPEPGTFQNIGFDICEGTRNPQWTQNVSKCGHTHGKHKGGLKRAKGRVFPSLKHSVTHLYPYFHRLLLQGPE